MEEFIQFLLLSKESMWLLFKVSHVSLIQILYKEGAIIPDLHPFMQNE